MNLYNHRTISKKINYLKVDLIDQSNDYFCSTVVEKVIFVSPACLEPSITFITD